MVKTYGTELSRSGSCKTEAISSVDLGDSPNLKC